MEGVDFESWVRKRKATVKVFIVECLFLGMEYSSTFMTLWIYITSLVKTDKPKLFYSLISAAFLLSACISPLIVGRLVDKSRHIRLTFLVCNCFVIVGNLVYVIHHSPWFLLVGRFVAGVGGSLRAVITGEICRCFSSEEQTNKFSANAMAFAMGFIIGPALNFFFKDIDVEFSIFHLTAANAPGFYMAGAFLLLQVYVLLAVHDLSKEYDLKACEVLKKNSECTINLSEDTKESCFRNAKHPSIMMNTIKKPSEGHRNTGLEENHFQHYQSLCNFDISETEERTPFLESQTTDISNILLQNINSFDVVLVLFLSFIMRFWIVAMDMWLPMMVIDVLHLGVTGLNSIIVGMGCISTMFLLLFICIQFSDKALFKWSLVCALSLALMDAIFAAIKLFPTSLFVNIILWMIWATLYSIEVVIDEVVLVGVFAKMTASSIQTFNEGLRLFMANLGALIALLTSAMLFEYVEYMSLVGIILSFLAFVLLLLRRKTLQHPQLTVR